MQETIQTKLNEIKNLDAGESIPDGLVENNITYFGYTIEEIYIDNDFDRNSTKKVILIGYLVRRKISSENTLKVINEISNEIIKKLKELNFKISCKDINLDGNIQKKEIKAVVYYNEINNKLVI